MNDNDKNTISEVLPEVSNITVEVSAGAGCSKDVNQFAPRMYEYLCYIKMFIVRLGRDVYHSILATNDSPPHGSDHFFSSIWAFLFNDRNELMPKHSVPDLEKAADFVCRENHFLSAAENGDINYLRYLMKIGEDIQAVDPLGRNALHLAIIAGQDEVFELLVKAGVNPIVKDNMCMTPLYLILMRRPSVKLLKLLFDYGARILPRKSTMDIGLFLSYVMICDCSPASRKILELLISHGSLINDPEAPGGRQALHLAAMANNSKLIDILVQLGADPFATNHRNETPRDVATIFKCTSAEITLMYWEQFILKRLSPQGSSIDISKFEFLQI